MAKVLGILLALVILSVSPHIFAGDIYTWEDENGVVHYSDTQPFDTSDWELKGTSSQHRDEQLNSRNQLRNYNAEEISEILDAISDEGEVATTEENNNHAMRVELYVTSWCTYCQKAKAFFRSRGIEFIEYNIEKDRQAAQRLRSLTQSKAVPFAVINGQQITGYSASAYVRALGK